MSTRYNRGFVFWFIEGIRGGEEFLFCLFLFFFPFTTMEGMESEQICLEYEYSVE